MRTTRAAANGAAFVLLVLASGAFAAQLPVDKAFGTTAGCALINRVNPTPAGERTVVQSSRMLLDGNNCDYTKIVDQGSTPQGGHGWQVGVSCDAGHGEEPVDGNLRITEPDKGEALTVELLSGHGPSGTFAACSPSP